MFKVDDYVVYQRDVCKITDLKLNPDNIEYYTLIPMSDASLKIHVLVNNHRIQSLINKEQLNKLLEEIPNISPIILDEKLIEKEYRSLLNSEKHEDLIKIIKTTHFRIKERLNNKKTIGDKEKKLFNLAETYLYNEFSVVLGISYEEIKDYIINLIEK